MRVLFQKVFPKWNFCYCRRFVRLTFLSPRLFRAIPGHLARCCCPSWPPLDSAYAAPPPHPAPPQAAEEDTPRERCSRRWCHFEGSPPRRRRPSRRRARTACALASIWYYCKERKKVVVVESACSSERVGDKRWCGGGGNSNSTATTRALYFTFDFRTVAGSRASATGSPRTLLARCTPPGSLSLLNEEMIELELVAAAVRK